MSESFATLLYIVQRTLLHIPVVHRFLSPRYLIPLFFSTPLHITNTLPRPNPTPKTTMSATKILGIDFAPFNIPLQRRLQTAVVFYWITAFVFFGFGFVFASLYILFCTDYYYIAVIYYLWFWYDRKQCHRGGRRSEVMRKSKFWTYLRDYFPIRTIKTAELDPKKNYLCGYHPHGIACVGAFTTFATEATGFSKIFPNIKPYLLTLTGQFSFPFHREFILLCGVCSVSKESVTWLLTNEGVGNMVVIVIGGASEALDAHPGYVRLTIKRRKGFVRLAIKEGSSLVPIFCFGENECFSQVHNREGTALRKVQNFMTKLLGFSPPIFYGRGIFQYNWGYVPYRHPIDVVVGKPIDVVKNPNPSEEEVNSYHALYIENLRKLFDEHKQNYQAYKDVELEIS